MDQSTTQPEPNKQTGVMKRVIIIAVIVTALTIIVISILTMINPNGTETPNSETDTVVMLTSSGVSPSVVQVAPGTTVTWVNESTSGLRLTGTSIDAGMALEGFGSDESFAEGESYSFTFDKEGAFTYEDMQSPEKINGTVIVRQE